MPDRSTFDLRIPRQPVVRPDQLTLTIRRTDPGQAPRVVRNERLDLTEGLRVTEALPNDAPTR
jgi:hypothetical protein